MRCTRIPFAYCNMRLPIFWKCICCALLMICPVVSVSTAIAEQDQPNIVLLLCDDLGYGDVQSFNPADGKIATPNIDRLASQGMMFTDAHSASSVCTPTRYGILTGRYCWRTTLQTGVVQGFAPCLIKENRPTIASFLKSQGYHTGIVGKWHLNNRYLNPETGEEYTDGKPLKFTAPVGTKTVSYTHLRAPRDRQKSRMPSSA